MKEAVKVAKTRRRPDCPEEAAFLELVRTTDLLSRGLVRVLKTEDLSSTQYNVLRILRGAREALPCGEIANRMITRDPDVTRLLDRMEKRDLISRNREEKDRAADILHHETIQLAEHICERRSAAQLCDRFTINAVGHER